MVPEYPAALIFDCDGVLVDSEIVAQRIERAHLASIGLHYEQVEFVHRFTGTSEPEFLRRVEDDALERLRIGRLRRARAARSGAAAQEASGWDH